MKPVTRKLQLFTLVIISTLMAELLSGSTPVSRIVQLLPQFLMYGSAAILIRGVARTLKLGWRTIILLGFAYGLIEEGLVLQSIFNPHFLGLNVSFGRAAGVNWVWAEFLTGLHCFWSITGSILVTEVIFHKERQEPWLGKTGLWVSAAVLLLISVAFHFLFIKINHFNAPPVAAISCLAIIIALVLIALKSAPELLLTEHNAHSGNKSFAVLLLITLPAGVLWFLGIHTIFNPTEVPAWVAMSGGLLIIVVYFTVVQKWQRVKAHNNAGRLGIASGLIGSELILGYTNTTANTLDHIGQIAIIAVTIILILILFNRVNKRELVITG